MSLEARGRGPRRQARGELWDGGMFGVVLEGTEVLLITLDGEVRAYHNRCPHQRPPLDRVRIEDGTIWVAVPD